MEEKEDAEKAQLNDVLERVYDQTLFQDMKIIIGDMLTLRLAKKVVTYMPTIGKHSFHKTSNDNGNRRVNLLT